MAIPPIQGSRFLPSPSDNSLLDQLKKLLAEYEKIMMKYLSDPSAKNLKDLRNMAQKLLSFIKANKKAIEQECKNNGWPAGGIGGYEREIQGAINSANTILTDPHPDITVVQMLNEDASGLIDMLSQKR